MTSQRSRGVSLCTTLPVYLSAQVSDFIYLKCAYPLIFILYGSAVLRRACLFVGMFVRLSIRARAYLRNYTTDLHQLFVYVTYGRGSVARAGGKLRVSGFVGDVTFGATSIPLQRLTSMRRRAQANAPAVSYWMRRVLDDGRQLH